MALLLQRMSEGLSYLRARAGEDHNALRDDDERLSGLKYRFVTTIEYLVNVAQHLCAAQGWGPPTDNADAVRVLARHGVLDAELADRLARAVGFRNVLVHQYAEVDDDRVVAMLDEVDDISDFTSVVSDWLLRQRE
ncbi:MAG TPA: DUF86 domain-containing protein [Nocardioidaceae bacterium]|nr:DUF86 domain-containing protein [Nocardioidaceae bacterium]